MFEGPKPNEIDNWVCVMQAGTEYEVEIAKNYLADHDSLKTGLGIQRQCGRDGAGLSLRTQGV